MHWPFNSVLKLKTLTLSLQGLVFNMTSVICRKKNKAPCWRAFDLQPSQHYWGAKRLSWVTVIARNVAACCFVFLYHPLVALTPIFSVLQHFSSWSSFQMFVRLIDYGEVKDDVFLRWRWLFCWGPLALTSSPSPPPLQTLLHVTQLLSSRKHTRKYRSLACRKGY